MRKLLLLTVGFFFLVTGIAFAGTVTVTSDKITGDKEMRVLDISCVGVISDTDLASDTDGISKTLTGWYLWRVIIENTSGTTPTANSDVYLKDEGDHDLLDGAGVDQLDNNTRNYVTVYTDDPIIDTPYLDVDNQSGTTAAYTVTFVLVKQNPGRLLSKVKVLGDEDIVLSGTTVYTLTASSTVAVGALIAVEGDAIRWKGYTTNPSADNGAILNEGDYLWLDSRTQIDNFGAIIKSGGSGTTIYVIYYGPED